MTLSHSRIAHAMPVPGADALRASEQLVARIQAEIARAGGWIPFSRYMEMALYEPGLGYYSNPGMVFGAAGDFVTAPELTPLFGATLARQLVPWLKHPTLAGEGQVVLEVGAGTGMLAAQLLNAMDNAGLKEVRYLILELSAERREQQRQTLKNLAPGLLSRVQWLMDFPERFAGVVVANELLDAMPVQIFEWRAAADVAPETVPAAEGQDVPAQAPADAAGTQGDVAPGAKASAASVDGAGSVQEMGVSVDEEGRFVWAARPADEPLCEAVQAVRAEVGEAQASAWPSPYRSEVCLAQQGWLKTLGERMSAGVVLLLDYGFAAQEYYHPQRAEGTLMCHYRHHSHTEPFLWPGLNDMTAHVDFSALARSAPEAGFSLLGYTNMATFLMNAGVLDELAELPREPEQFWFAQAQAVQQLISEAEMGAFFKVIAFERGMPAPVSALGFGE